jgi:chemotaxis protein histidine kinase CheA
MSDNDSDIVKDFLVESYENLDRLARDLVGHEAESAGSPQGAQLFRAC